LWLERNLSPRHAITGAAELSSQVAKQIQQHSRQSIDSDLNFLFLKVLVSGALQALSSLEYQLLFFSKGFHPLDQSLIR